MVLLAPGIPVMPGVSPALAGGLDLVEPDARTVPWGTIERLVLEAGLPPPAYRPLSEQELAALLDEALERAMTGRAPGIDDDELDLLRWWRDRYATGGWAPTWIGCACKVHPPRVRSTARALLGWQELGDPLAGESGLDWSGGANAAGELTVDATLGAHWWFGVTGRASGRLVAGETLDPGHPLSWPNWPLATGRAQVGTTRQQGGVWTLALPRAMAGVRLGNWALSAGWEPRRVGPGRSGGLTLDHGGATFPALTGRRTAPFRWSGIMRWLAPSELLLRVGTLSERQVRLLPASGLVLTRQDPWFMEWLLGWEPVSWFRFTATQGAMAASQDGTLWPDILQINFPLIGATWAESAHGPVTDRIFALGFEGRWRNAPWPVLPSTAGRIWWEYGGTDFLPSGPGGVWPQIAAPASVAGVALLSPRWDLEMEYTELWHETVIWYSNSGFVEGYTQDGQLLAHQLGGSGESLAGTLRVRPAGWGLEGGLTLSHATWGIPGRTPGTGERWSLLGSLARLPQPDDRAPLLWTLNGEVRREQATPPAAPPTRRTWGRVWLELRLP